MAYEGIICRIDVRDHPNADKLSLANANGFQVIVSKDTPDQATGVFFMADTQLSHKLCMEAGLYRKHPETGEELGGYLEANRRVRSMKLRGEISEGLWLPIERLDFLGETFSLGDLVGVVGNRTVAEKYIPQHIKNRIANRGKGQARQLEVEFPTFLKHYDTSQLRMNLGKITRYAIVVMTEKLHGTSGRSGYLKRETKLQSPWWAFWRRDKKHSEYDKAYGSRNVVFDGSKVPVSANPDTHGNSLKDDYRWNIHQSLNLYKGETIYYEIVGYEPGGASIMPAHKLGKTDPVHKEIAKKYGTDVIRYTYGCEEGQYDFYVYRITMTSEEGVVTELSWDQTKRRCHLLGIKHVPELGRVIFGNKSCPDTKTLLRVCSESASGRSMLDNHPREGVCVRVMSPTCDEAFKYKGFEFCHLEGIAKQDETYIDTEDIS